MSCSRARSRWRARARRRSAHERRRGCAPGASAGRAGARFDARACVPRRSGRLLGLATGRAASGRARALPGDSHAPADRRRGDLDDGRSKQRRAVGPAQALAHVAARNRDARAVLPAPAPVRAHAAGGARLGTARACSPAATATRWAPIWSPRRSATSTSTPAMAFACSMRSGCCAVRRCGGCGAIRARDAGTVRARSSWSRADPGLLAAFDRSSLRTNVELAERRPHAAPARPRAPCRRRAAGARGVSRARR